MRKHHGHEQAPQSRNENMPCPTQLKLSNAAYEQVADNKVECAPKHIHHGGREPLPWGRGKRALERVPCNAAHKMRDRICEKGSAKKVRNVMIPTHIEFSFEKARKRWSPQILRLSPTVEPPFLGAAVSILFLFPQEVSPWFGSNQKL
jgi:hypothetical protein